MAETNAALVALDKINAQRNGSFAIVSADDARNYYAQFLADGASGLYVEIVGDEFLDPAHRLTEAQHVQMRERGWRTEPGHNWSKEWPDASTPEARQRIALDTLSTLSEVHGASGGVRVEVNLEGPGAREASTSLAESGIAPVSNPTPSLLIGLVAAAVVGLVVVVLLLLS
ncbi:MAG: hypothetical protein ABJF88_05355 [Rhodothermales bacterium]